MFFNFDGLKSTLKVRIWKKGRHSSNNLHFKITLQFKLSGLRIHSRNKWFLTKSCGKGDILNSCETKNSGKGREIKGLSKSFLLSLLFLFLFVIFWKFKNCKLLSWVISSFWAIIEGIGLQSEAIWGVSDWLTSNHYFEIPKRAHEINEYKMILKMI